MLAFLPAYEAPSIILFIFKLLHLAVILEAIPFMINSPMLAANQSKRTIDHFGSGANITTLYLLVYYKWAM